jgi:hypothetical protein
MPHIRLTSGGCQALAMRTKRASTPCTAARFRGTQQQAVHATNTEGSACSTQCNSTVAAINLLLQRQAPQLLQVKPTAHHDMHNMRHSCDATECIPWTYQATAAALPIDLSLGMQASPAINNMLPAASHPPKASNAAHSTCKIFTSSLTCCTSLHLANHYTYCTVTTTAWSAPEPAG